MAEKHAALEEESASTINGPAEQSRYDSRKRRKIEEEEHAEDIQLSSDGSSQESDDQTTQKLVPIRSARFRSLVQATQHRAAAMNGDSKAVAVHTESVNVSLPGADFGRVSVMDPEQQVLYISIAQSSVTIVDRKSVAMHNDPILNVLEEKKKRQITKGGIGHPKIRDEIDPRINIHEKIRERLDEDVEKAESSMRAANKSLLEQLTNSAFEQVSSKLSTAPQDTMRDASAKMKEELTGLLKEWGRSSERRDGVYQHQLESLNAALDQEERTIDVQGRAMKQYLAGYLAPDLPQNQH